MARKIFQKPTFISLRSTATTFHFLNDSILLKWEVTDALFVKTNLSKKIYSSSKTIVLPTIIDQHQIIITAFGLFGITSEEIILEETTITSAPDLKYLSSLKLVTESVVISPYLLPANVEFEATLKSEAFHQIRMSPLISKLNTYSNNGTKGEVTGLGIRLPVINIYE